MQKDRQNMRHYERNVLYNGWPIDLRLISSVSVLFRTLVRLNSDTFVRLRTLSYRVRLSSIGLFKFRTLPFNFGPFHPIFNFGQFRPLSDASVRFWTVASDFNRFHQFRVFSSGFGCWHCLTPDNFAIFNSFFRFNVVAFDFGSVKFDFEGNGFIKSLNKLVTKYKSCWYNFEHIRRNKLWDKQSAHKHIIWFSNPSQSF